MSVRLRQNAEIQNPANRGSITFCRPVEKLAEGFTNLVLTLVSNM